MRSVTLVVPALACALLILATPTHAASDPFAAFRIPDHAWQSGSFGLSFAGNRSSGHSESPDGTQWGSSRDGELRTTGSLSLACGHDSDDLLRTLSLSLNGDQDWNSRFSHSEWYGETYETRYFERAPQASVIASAALRVYPDFAPLGLDFSASAQGATRRSTSREDDLELSQDPLLPERRESRRDIRSETDRSTATVRGGVGVGRVRDATALYDAHLIEVRLTESGALARPLSPHARALLAQLLYVAPRFSSAHERPERFVWDEVETILDEDGALPPDGLAAYALLRALEPTAPTTRPQRLRGAFAGLGGSYETSHESRRTTWTTTHRYVDEGEVSAGRNVLRDMDKTFADALWLGGWGELHRPLGWAWQLDASTSLMAVARHDEHGLDLDEELALRWFLADRWQMQTAASHRRYYRAPGHDRPYRPEWIADRWDATWGISLGYYLEDQTLVQFALSETQQRERYASSAWFDRSGRVSLSLSHRFLGSLDVPGLP
jgi:hypothetical protein